LHVENVGLTCAVGIEAEDVFEEVDESVLIGVGLQTDDCGIGLSREFGGEPLRQSERCGFGEEQGIEGIGSSEGFVEV
jgi:hypothetical protein